MSVESFVDQTTPEVLSLSDQRAANPAWAGAKAARLAEALRHGLPVLPGFVITDPDMRSGYDIVRTIGVRSAWAQISDNGALPVVVRSSSTVEDGDTSSMAGMFTSVVNVQGWRDFGTAVERVLASARDPRLGEPKPMAVLVQPHLDANVGGVLFGADPVTGRTDRFVIAAAAGGPHRLVDGSESGKTYTVTPHGRLIATEGPGEARLTRRQLRNLSRLARRARAAFGEPQDIEWAIDHSGRLFLLQSRPLTGLPAPVSDRAPLLGPGPVAETFPDPLTVLEQDLWVTPLRNGLVNALALTGAAPARQLRSSPVVTVVDGRVVADLDLLDPSRRTRRFVRLIDPRPGMRRLRSAWRVGRLRSSLPPMTAEVLTEVDTQLIGIPPLSKCTDDQLVSLMQWAGNVLTVLHAHEVAAGVLLETNDSELTASSIALRVLAQGRAAGEDVPSLAGRQPVVLALVPPAVRREPAQSDLTLPDRLASEPPPAIDELPPREAARLRIRWVQELGARAALEAGRRLAVAEIISSPDDVRHLNLADLVAALRERRTPLTGPAPAQHELTMLPAAFRLNRDGRPVAALDERRRRRSKAKPGFGTPAAGGRGVGPVHYSEPQAGSVLVVQTLDPGLAVHLPKLAGLVAETGNPLSHLAILAREFGVPTVVGVPDARTHFPDGARVLVDGDSGQVLRLDLSAEEESA